MTSRWPRQLPWTTVPAGSDDLSPVRLEALLQELLGRVDEMLHTQDRLQALLDAVVGLGADLDLTGTLDRLVTAACELAGARYGALGVLDQDGRRVVRFVAQGMTPEEIAAIGAYPQGHGVLGLLIQHPAPIRLRNIAEHPQFYGFPPNHPPMTSFLGVPIRTQEQVFGNLYLTEKADGADFTEDDERIVTALAAAAAAMIGNARLYGDTEDRRRWHEATAEITQLMLGDFDPRDVLQLIARRAREVSGSAVGVLVLSRDGELLLEAVDGPEQYQRYQGRELPTGLPILDHILADGQQVVIDDLAEAVRGDDRLADAPELASLGRTIFAPLPSGAFKGFLVVAAERGADVGATTGADMLHTFAGQATIALDRAQAQRQREILAVRGDRDRIARDLHDLVIQRLFATGLQLEVVHKAEHAELGDRIGQAVQDIDTTIRDLRSTILKLYQ